MGEMFPVMVATLANVLSAAVSPSLETNVVVVVGGIVVVGGGVGGVVVDVVEVVVELDLVVSTDTETLDVVATDPADMQAEVKTIKERTAPARRHDSYLQPNVINVHCLTRPKGGGKSDLIEIQAHTSGW